MHIIEKIESKERCAESGWYAYDYILEEKMTPAFIRSLQPLGSFLYLTMLRPPFFKIESDYYFIKGVEGNNFLRVAVHDEHPEKYKEIESLIEHDTVE